MSKTLTNIAVQTYFSDPELPFSNIMGSILKGSAFQLPENQISIWIKIAYTLFVIGLIPVYWKQWGPANFLWFSDLALFLTVVALWMESSLITSMMAVGVLIPELYWNLELIIRLFTGYKLAGLTNYMWNRKYPLYLRLLSLFHVVLPAILIYMLFELGYNPSAIYYQTLFAWVILFLCYKLTPPSANINWTFGLGNAPQHKISSKYFILLIMAAYPLIIFLPTNFLLKMIFIN